MSDTSGDRAEGLRMYDELIAVHTILRRGSALVADSLAALAQGGPVDVGTLVSTARWHSAFLHHHHASEDEEFWPLLRRLFPDSDADLVRLTAEHAELDVELKSLADAVSAIGAREGRSRDEWRAAARELAASTAHPAAVRAQKALGAHLDGEEPVLRELFPLTPAADIRTLRAAIVAAAPKSGPDLVLGLLVDPDPAPGYEQMVSNFPPPVRWLRPLLLRRYRGRRRALGV
jgi:hemerythrin-like domain-containing protein